MCTVNTSDTDIGHSPRLVWVKCQQSNPCTGPQSSRRLRLPECGKVVSQVTFLVLIIVRGWGHCAAGKIMTMKNPNYTIGNGTRDLPACSAVPQTTVPPRDRRLTCIRSSFYHVLVNVLILTTYTISEIHKSLVQIYTEWHKKRELLKNATKIEEIQEKKNIDRNCRACNTHRMTQKNGNFWNA